MRVFTLGVGPAPADSAVPHRVAIIKFRGTDNASEESMRWVWEVAVGAGMVSIAALQVKPPIGEVERTS